MKTNIFWSLLLLLGMLTFFSCQKDSDELPDENEETEEPHNNEEDDIDDDDSESRDLLEGESVLSIRLTDAPIDLQAVNVDIVGMHIVADGTRFELSAVQGIYNLLDFQDGIDTLISVDTFNIDFLKDLVLELGDNNSVIDMEGVEHPLELPSANRDFLTIKVNQRLDSLQLMDVQIDFDACKSVHETGNGRWILKPVTKINRINDRPLADPELDFEADKISMIKAAYPDYDKFDIERKKYCFADDVVIEVEMSSANEEQIVIMNADCELVYKARTVELTELADHIVESAKNAVSGNIDLFKKVISYTSVNSELVYGFRAMTGQGNAGKQVNIYLDEAGELICTE